MNYTFYTRPVDANNGRQNVIVENGIIIEQYLAARQGYYTGDGNPELIGRSKNALRGKGFHKVKGPHYFHDVLQQWRCGDYTPSFDDTTLDDED